MSIPTVSMIVPIYNGSAYLAETLRSLLSQTFENFELLAIDDGSTDGSAEIVTGMGDERIRLITKSNSGLCDALNLGIEQSRAPFIGRCDQDDISVPERLARQVEVMKADPDALALFTYTTKFGARRSWSNADKVHVAKGQTKLFEPWKDGSLLGSTMLARADALRALAGYRPGYYPADDWDLELRMSQSGKVLVLREQLVAYRFHSGANTYRTFALMNERSRWAEDSYRRREQAEPELTLSEFRLASPKDLRTRFRRFRKDVGKLHMRIAGQSYLDGRYLAAGIHLLAAAFTHPADLSRRLRRRAGFSLTEAL